MFGEVSIISDILVFIGHPYATLTITTMLTLYIFGTMHGYSREELQHITTNY